MYKYYLDETTLMKAFFPTAVVSTSLTALSSSTLTLTRVLCTQVIS